MISTNIFYFVIGYILLTITKVLDSLWTLFIGRFLVGKNRTIKKKNVFRPFGLLTLASQDLAVVRTLWWLPIMWVKLPKPPCEVPLPPSCSWWSLLEFCLLMPSIFMTLYIGWQSPAFVLVFLVRKSFFKTNYYQFFSKAQCGQIRLKVAFMHQRFHNPPYQ